MASPVRSESSFNVQFRARRISRTLAPSEPSEAVERAVTEAIDLIEEDGAEVITFACSDVFWLQKHLQKRLHEIGWEVPVLEGYGSAIVLAKMFVDLGVDASGLNFPSERPRQWRRKKRF